MSPEAILAEYGMTGRLDRVAGDLWQFRGEIGADGVAAEIRGEPDEATLREAAKLMRAAFD